MAKGKWEPWLADEGLTLLRGWARDGLTEDQIAHNMGIARSTLSDWKNRFSDISEALKKGKDIVDLEVENAVFKRATGYDYVEEKIEYECGVEVKRTVINKHVPPDVGAAAFWLKNRRPDKWRDKQQIEADVDTNIEVKFDGELVSFAK